ncbi:uncharacterized protein LOC130892669 [Diorhabda carinulata]|uniref:uncharacterized protein LOC130892669 n=1 Tax=Diorhabda carinulata TaxID=1163345 RepID=UPI0025A218E5|nr:uncharacterized protein LOC130892669 [Diorhabda carinulata]
MEDNMDEDLKLFIHTFESMPELWSSTDPNYMKKNKRMEALNKLLPLYKKIKPNAEISDVRKKINTLRSNFRKELKKIESSKRSGCGTEDIYTPSSWVFYALQFLDKIEQPFETHSSIDVENEEEEQV